MTPTTMRRLVLTVDFTEPPWQFSDVTELAATLAEACAEVGATFSIDGLQRDEREAAESIQGTAIDGRNA